METTDTHLRVKLGAAEIEYHGDKETLRTEVMPTISKIVEMFEKRQVPESFSPSQPALESTAAAKAFIEPGVTPDSETLSTSTIAVKLKVDSGADLAFAGAVKLTIFDKKERISRSEILDEMKTATAFYRATYNNNLTGALDRLVKNDQLRLISPNTYSMSLKARQDAEEKLANSH